MSSILTSTAPSASTRSETSDHEFVDIPAGEFTMGAPKDHDGYNALQENYLMNLYHPKRIATDFRQGLATSGIYLDPQKIEFLVWIVPFPE